MPTWTGSCQPTTTHEEPVDRPPRRGPVWVPTTHAMVAGWARAAGQRAWPVHHRWCRGRSRPGSASNEQPGPVHLRLADIEPLALALHKVQTATRTLAQATATYKLKPRARRGRNPDSSLYPQLSAGSRALD